MSKKPNRDDAILALKMYSVLGSLDDKIAAMKVQRSYRDTALQKVTFYMCAGGFSGPTDYEPKHNAVAIAFHILADMEITRAGIVADIHALGFDVE